MTDQRDVDTAATDPGGRSAAELEREVRESRAGLERTLEAIQDRLSPGQLVDQVTRYLRDNGGELAHNFGETVKRNPVPAALVGVGLAWMMVSGLRGNGGPPRSADPTPEDFDDPDYDPDYGADPGAWPAYRADVAAGSGAAADPAAAGLGEGLSEPAQRARQGLSEAALRTRTGFGEAAEGAAEAVGSAKARMGRVARGTRARAAGMRAGVADRAHRAGARARHYGERAQEGFFETLHRQPLVLGAVGLAVGAAIGAALPASRREDELMGDTSDQLKRRARATGREEYAKAKASAAEVYAAAEGEAERQGLSREGLESAARSTRDKVESVADAASEAARREADRRDPGSGAPTP